MAAFIYRAAAAVCLAFMGGAAGADTSDLTSERAFRVCADPANLPFSNEAEEGFENKIAELLAGALNRPLIYTWYPQVTGFIRRTLGDNRCDVVIGYAQGHELVLNTNHYYVSAYSLVTRAGGPLSEVNHLRDPALQGVRLGVVAGAPPATHMARAGLIGAAKPYPLFVDTRHDSPHERMVDDLLSGEIDGAVIWGPIAGWRAKTAPEPLTVTPLLREEGPPRMFFRITLGVRRGEDTWKRRLNSLLRRNRAGIDEILREYGVPLVDQYGRPQDP